MASSDVTLRPLSQQHPREYSCWKNMLSRCRNPRTPGWKRYGGRGISVCDRWKVFAAFLEDMGPSPSRKHQIERIDNDGNYEPGNCCWATAKEQQANTVAIHRITYRGITLTIAEWGRIYDIPVRILRHRLNVQKWLASKALRTPVRRRLVATQPSAQPGCPASHKSGS